jgi:hypothetical protein
MNPVQIVYVIGWVTACVIALVVAVVYRQGLLDPGGYARFLLVPWKVGTFVAATSVFVVAAPLSGDPTWDTTNSILVGTLTFVTAPWSVATIFRAVRGKTRMVHGLVAAVVSVAAACWSYDLHILLTRGHYPPGWLANLPLSLSLYLAAGMFWNLDWRKAVGIKFAFQHDDWPTAPAGNQLLRLLPVAILMMLFVAFVIGLFVFEEQIAALGLW